MVSSSEAVDDGLNLDHLHLPQSTTKAGKTKTGALLAKRKLNELFIHWLTQPETQEHVNMLLQEGNRNDANTRDFNDNNITSKYDVHNENNIKHKNAIDNKNNNNAHISSSSSTSPKSGLTINIATPEEISPPHKEGNTSTDDTTQSPESSDVIKGPLANVWNMHNTQPPRSPTNTPKHNPFGSPSEHKTSKKHHSPKRYHQEITMEYPASPVTLPESHQNETRKQKERNEQERKEKEKEEKRRKLSESIPRFYFPKNDKPSKEEMQRELRNIREYFDIALDGFTISEFVAATQELCEFPTFFNSVLFRKIDTKNTGKITLEMFEDFWNREMACKSKKRRIFDFIKQPQNQYIIFEDFEPFIFELLETHPGLDFLKATPGFQEKYTETVITRIFYRLDRSATGIITFKQFKNSDLEDTMKQLDFEEDINLITEYFSYEHFYVLYCKFWELDTDHDFVLDHDDLLRYGNYSLTEAVVQRIFEGAPKKLTGSNQRMSYRDFIWFCLSEEDKTSNTAIEYWFRCLDLDSDNKIRTYELRYFYREQMQRMELMSKEVIPFDDILIQMFDMIKPRDITGISLGDLKRCGTAKIFFNAMFNLNKFLAHEHRDPFSEAQERSEFPNHTDWDLFARFEYDRMAREDEEEEWEEEF